MNLSWSFGFLPCAGNWGTGFCLARCSLGEQGTKNAAMRPTADSWALLTQGSGVRPLTGRGLEELRLMKWLVSSLWEDPTSGALGQGTPTNCSHLDKPHFGDFA